jgi:gluconolactonase
MKWKEGEGISLFMQPAGYTGVVDYSPEPGSNGLNVNKKGEITFCEHGDRRISVLTKNGGKRTLVDNYQGKRLNSPNDSAFKSNGDLYFTDPPYGLPKNFDDPRRELDFCGVYRLGTDGKLTLLTKDMTRPNGIAFSPDEKYLYVGNWDPAAKVVLRFPVKRDGTLGASSVFADLTQEVPGEEALDGIKVDKLGNLYLSAPDGLRIYSSAGKHLGTVIAPRPIHNFAWGADDGRTLYLTARDRLYRIALLTEGVRP